MATAPAGSPVSGNRMIKYALQIGPAAVDRLLVLDEIHDRSSNFLLSQAESVRPSRILDLGCGIGLTTERLARIWPMAERIVGIDREAEQIDVALARSPARNIAYRVGEIEQALDDVHEYDLVYGRFVFSHNRQSHQLMKAIYENMRPGAALLIEEPDIGTAFTLHGSGILEEVEALYLKLGNILHHSFLSGSNLAKHASEICSNSSITFIHPVLSKWREKSLYLLGLNEAGGRYIEHGLIDELELPSIKDRLKLEIDDESSLFAAARLMQLAMWR